MQTITFKSNRLTATALLLTLPTVYFIIIAVLKYELGIDRPFDAIAPMLESWGIKEALGWNINLLILFGPLLAFFLTIFQILKIEWYFTKEEFRLNFALKKIWFPLSLAMLSAGVLLILFLYALGENCHCE
jgi:hypothetical protein